MPLTPGTRLGPYEITAQIGVGGMGEVYRATDANLGRQVAIKVLPEAFAQDAERLARFEREAKTLASLNHPNIAAVYGFEKGEHVRALVMELVEGPTLADRLAAQPIPIDEALPIARQIAEALEAAHEQGIVHRDLKPANVKVRDDGTVKVLDFGLAKMVDSAVASGVTSAGAHSLSPTITTPAMTQLGVILGTAAYMSPEQAKGKAADKRSDIWAFGCVLYEMLTGKRAFAGEDVTDTLAFVISREPEWSALPTPTPVAIRKLLRRCLEKDRKRRLADIADARLDLDDGSPDSITTAAPPVDRGLLSRVSVTSFVIGVCLAAAIGIAAAGFLWPRPTGALPMRFAISPPDGWSVSSGTRFGGVATASLAVSPNGRRVAFLARNADGRDRLWIRSLDTLAARELPGTDGAIGPFWSPDSDWLGFYAGGSLQKIAVAGGVPIPLCDVVSFNSASWGTDGVIIFAWGLGGRGASSIKRVSASGGVVTDANALAKDDNSNHVRPAFLPDGRHFLFRVVSGPNAGYYVTSLDSTDRTRVLGADVFNVVVAGGHVLFLRDTTLMAQPFDMQRLALVGAPVPIADRVERGSSGVGMFSASSTVLAYQTATGGGGSKLTWFDRNGKPLDTASDRAEYADLSLAPDETHALVSVAAAGGRRDIWLVDLARRIRSRFTFDAGDETQSVWFPDGRRVIFSADRKGRLDLYEKDAQMLGAENLLYGDDADKWPLSVSPDRQFLLYAASIRGNAIADLWILPLSGDRRPRLFLGSTPYSERDGRFSPDGRVIAYTSDEGGTPEVFIAPFPGPGGKRQISTDGGSAPAWNRDGTEIYFLDRDERLMVASVSPRDGFAVGDVRPLFAIQRGGQRRVYDVSPDGQRILVNTADEQASVPFTVVINWAEGLNK